MTLLELAIDSGELRLVSADPREQPYLDYNYLQEEFDRKRMRERVRLSVKLGEHPALAELIQERIAPTDEELATDDTLDAYMLRIASTYPAPARWVPQLTQRQWLTSTAECMALRGCAWRTPLLCRTASAPTRM